MKEINKTGFTILELLVVISIVFMITVIALPMYNTMRTSVALNNYSYEIVNALRLAQSRSIVSQDGTSHGVYFNHGSYILYGGDWTAPNYTFTYPINGGIQILTGSDSDVSFDRLTGSTADQTITIGIAGSNQKTIQIDEEGRISIL